MLNQLLKIPERYLRTEYGQPYVAPSPARDGYWLTGYEPQRIWVPVTVVRGTPLLGHWSLTYYWYDPAKGNQSWYGQASDRQTIHMPFVTRQVGGREEIAIDGPPKVVRTWVPPTPYDPGQPFVPDKHVYEDNAGWDAGARAIQPVAMHSVIHWRTWPQARGVVVGLAKSATAGRYWLCLVGVKAEDGVATVVANGAEVAHLGRFNADTKFSIAYTDEAFKVLVDGVLRHSMPLPPDASPLVFDVSLYRSGDYVFAPSISFEHVASAYGSLQPLRGLAMDEGFAGGIEPDEGIVYMAAPAVWGSAYAQGVDGDVISGTLASLMGVASDDDEYAGASGVLQPLAGEAVGYRDLPPQEDPVLLYAPIPSISASDAAVDVGTEEFYAPALQGIAAQDEDYAVAYGQMPAGRIYCEQEDANEDELLLRARGAARVTGNDLQEVALIQRAKGGLGLSADGVSQVAMAARAYVQGGFALSHTSGAVMQVTGALAVFAHAGGPHDSHGVSVMACHAQGGRVTEFTGYNFQSFAKINGRYYGVASDGVYVLEGNDDAGEDIFSHIDFGTQRMGSSVLKAVPAVYAGIASQAPASLIVETRQGAYRYLQRGTAPRLQTQRFDLGRGLRDTHYDVAIEALAAGFELESVEFGAATGARRI